MVAGIQPTVMMGGLRQETIPPELFEKYLERLPRELNELFVDGKKALIEQLVNRVYFGLHEREVAKRKLVSVLQYDGLPLNAARIIEGMNGAAEGEAAA